jgi:PAS domain S-box-containing protein
MIAYLDTAFNFIRVNKAYARAGGHEPEFFIGKNHFDLYPHPENERIFRQVVKAGEPYTAFGKPFEYPERPEMGVTYWDWNLQPVFDDKAKVEGLILSLIDVTARERAQQEYLRLAAAIENAREGVLILDKERNIRYVNPAFAHALGFTKEELIGKKSDMLIMGQSDEQFFNEIQETISRGETWNGPYKRQKRDGSTFDIDMTVYPIRDGSGNVTDYVVVERDVTRERRLQRRVQHIQKMEALGTLAGGVAHDFNNILMPILVNTEMAFWDIPEDSPVRNYLKLSLDAAERGRELVKQITAFSRPSPEEKEPIKLAPVIKEALRFLKSTLPSNFKIYQNIRSESGAVLANATQIYQVLVNLCNNASHALGRKGGKVRVELAEVRLDGAVLERNPDLKNKECVRLSVSDTGCGMSEEVIEKIFDPFFTTKKRAEGTGMGLAVVHGIVKNHGGSIEVHSKEGEGTTFEVFFPQVRERLQKESRREKHIKGGREHILLVDDEAAVLQSLQQVLKHFGYRVTAEENGKKALKTFKDQSKSFDLVITDQIMPGLLGTDLSRKILSLRPDIPIVLCTGYGDTIDREKAQKMGIRGFFFKPARAAEIAQTIRQILDG